MHSSAIARLSAVAAIQHAIKDPLDILQELAVVEPGHRMFRTPAIDVHVHLWSDGDPEVDEVLMFRDWLRANAADRALYEAEKRRLAALEWSEMQEYADAKTPVVSEIKARARS